MTSRMVDPQDAPRKPSEMFEIRVNGVWRTHRDVRRVAIETARLLAEKESGVTIFDPRTGQDVPL